ncbi:MAG: hypothetical protein Q8R83_05470 [Legionellaceae bacterium]|nr:hypothetical protein [Legionellaceae bacterium]
MKTTTVVRSVNNNDITVIYAEPVGQNNTQTIIIRERAVSKESFLTSTLLLAAGVLFWAHGSASHDAWFKGEEVTGQAITGFCIALVGLMCCFGCVAAYVAADSHDSEIEASPAEASRANRFLTKNAPRQLMADLFKAADKAEECLEEDNSVSCGV